MSNIINNLDIFLKNLSETSFVEKIAPFLTKGLFTVLLSSCLIIALYLLYSHHKFSKEEQRLLNIPSDDEKIKLNKTESKFDISKLRYFKSLKKVISKYYFFEDDSKKENIIYYGVLLIELVFILTMMYINKLFIGVVLLLIFHFVAIKIIDISAPRIDYIVRENLPIIIKHFIKVLSKTSDLKIVIYEVSHHINEPLKQKFEKLSLKMLSENDAESLNDFAEEIDNIWMYAFVFLVLSLKEHSQTQDVIDNLKSLSHIIEEENKIRDEDLAQKKPNVIMNYSIMGLGIIAGVANLTFNDVAYSFFFESIAGMFVFLGGVGAILMTFVVNTILLKESEGR